MTPGVLTAGSGRPWESALVSALAAPGAAVQVVRRCADVADVLAVASTGQVVAAIVASDLRHLDSEVVHQLRATRVAVVAVHPVADRTAPLRLARIGVDVVVGDDGEPEEIVAATLAAVAELTVSGPVGTGVTDTAVADTRAALLDPSAGATTTARGAPAVGGSGRQGTPGMVDGGPAEPGMVIAVWGPTGAPGRTTVAAGLATEAAAAGITTLLIDADVYGGVLASAFGLLEESPGLAAACRLAANGRLDPPELARLSWQLGDRLQLLTGIPRPDRWPELRPSSIPVVLEVARQVAALVVVDCGFGLETDEEITFDTVAPRRNGATLAALADADRVIVVGSADPPGMERLVRGMGELAEAVPGVVPAVVLNRLRRSAAGRDEAADALRTFVGLEVAAFLPEDRAATDLAWRRGKALAEVAPGSALRTALSTLTADLTSRVPAGLPGR